MDTKRIDPESRLNWARGILMEKLRITDDIVAFYYLLELAEKGLTSPLIIYQKEK